MVSAIEHMWNFGDPLDTQLNVTSKQSESPSVTNIIRNSVQSQSTQHQQTPSPNQQFYQSPTDSVLKFSNKVVIVSDLILANITTVILFVGCHSKEWTDIGKRLAALHN
jgi:hypothetical protein